MAQWPVALALVAGVVAVAAMVAGGTVATAVQHPNHSDNTSDTFWEGLSHCIPQEEGEIRTNLTALFQVAMHGTNQKVSP